jgi:integrase
MKIHVRERKRADGESSFSLDYCHNGERRRETLPFRTRADALKAYSKTPREMADLAASELARRLLREEEGLARNPNITLSEILEAFLDHKKSTIKTAHILTTWTAQVLQIVGDRPARALKPMDWRRLIRALQERGDNPETVNKKIGLAKAAFAYASKTGEWRGDNPVAHVERLSDPRPPAWRWLRSDEIDRLLEYLRNGKRKPVARRNGRDYERHFPPPPGMLDLVIVLLNTGARLGEALALTWRDVDLTRGAIRVVTTKRASKGRKALVRHVPINDALAEHLGAMGPGEPDTPVLTIARNNIRRKFMAACQDAGIVGHCRVHDMRHTFCSHLAQAGVPLNTVRELAGHATMDMTLRYSHLCPATRADAVGVLNFGGAAKTARIMAVGE